MAPERLFITGASGFVGRHLLNALKGSHRIFALARGSAEVMGAPVGPSIEWIQADIADSRQMASVLERLRAAGGVDVVIHLAAYYDFTGKSAPEYERTNVVGMRNVLDVTRALQPRCFLFASSVAACDFTKAGQVVNEDSPPDGDNPYARSKRIGERLVGEYRTDFRSGIVRLAALFSDWCEFEPLSYFLETWLSPGWRRRVLGGRGKSAIPYLHIQDAVAFFEKLIESDDRFDSGEVFLASPDGGTSHDQLHAVATACHFGERIRPIRMPRLACVCGIWMLHALGQAAGHRPFERPWMGACIDRRLDVDAGRTRARLDWAPRERLDILRRMPFLVHNRKAHYDEWLRRNHAATRRSRLRASARIHDLLSVHQQDISKRFREYLEEPAQRARLSSYLGCPPSQLEERHRLLHEQLLCAVRSGDKAVFMNCCRHMAERWWVSGLPLGELGEALEGLGHVCTDVLGEDPAAAELSQAIYDEITMTFQFAIDSVRELDEHLMAREPADTAV